MIGYAFGPHHEIVLEDEKDFPLVLKAIFEHMNSSEIKITVPAFRKERIEALAEICESCSIETTEMINILNRKKVLETLLKFKASYQDLQDGAANFRVEDEAFRITVSGGIPMIEAVDDTSVPTLSATDFIQKFFDIPSIIIPDNRFKNWLPLPFMIDSPDCY